MTEAHRFVVDGEEFDVVREGGSIHFTWASGPHANYGFSIGGPDALRTDDEMRIAVRAFLSDIDPRTGYVAAE